jgi:hypothetical protein
LDGLEKSFRFIIPNDGLGPSTVKVVMYKDLFPGQDHGPKGTGTSDMYYDKKVKKWGESQYVQSNKDAHPIRNFLQEGDKRYEGEEGFKNLTGDVGTGAKIIGGAVAIVAPPIGAAIYEAGSIMSDVGEAHGVLVDLKNGEKSKAAISTVGLLLGNKASEAVSALPSTEAKKMATKMAADLILDQTKDALKEKIDKDNGKK